MFDDLINSDRNKKAKVTDKELIRAMKGAIADKDALIKQLIKEDNVKDALIKQLIKKIDYLRNL